MTTTKIEPTTHPTELELADFLTNSMPAKEREHLWAHIADCDECLKRVVSAYESVGLFRKDRRSRKGKLMKKINPYLVLGAISFLLSFAMPDYFIQLLVATLLFGAKWIVDSKSAKMLIMIYEAWKNGGEEGASRILETLDIDSKRRF